MEWRRKKEWSDWKEENIGRESGRGDGVTRKAKVKKRGDEVTRKVKVKEEWTYSKGMGQKGMDS